MGNNNTRTGGNAKYPEHPPDVGGVTSLGNFLR